MLSANVTVCVFAFNEEHRLARCLRNFIGRFDILVVDNFSADRTLEVARSLGVRAISVKNPGFIETPEVMGEVFRNVTTTYVLLASVSEYVPLALLSRYAEVANSTSYDVVRAFRQSITAGQPVPISGRPGREGNGSLTFFRIGSVDYSGNEVHGRGTITAAPGRILSFVAEPSLFFYHFRDYDCSKSERVHAVYDDVLARQWHQRQRRFSLSLALLDATKTFLNTYLRHGCWRFGMLGFIQSYYRYHMVLTTWFRLWEWQSGHDLDGVKRLNDAARRRFESNDERAGA